MKKLFVLFICALFLVSTISFAAAQVGQTSHRAQYLTTSPVFQNLDAASLQKLGQLSYVQLKQLEQKFTTLTSTQVQTIVTALDVPQLQRATQLSSAAIHALANNPAAIQARVANIQQVRTQAQNAETISNAYRVRQLTASVITQARNRFQTANTNYVAAKEALQNKKADIDALKDAYIACEDVVSTECDETRENYFTHLKEWMLRMIEGLKRRVEMHMEQIKASNAIDTENAEEIIADFELMLTELADLESRVQAATEREELLSLLQELREWIKENVPWKRFHLMRLWWNHLRVMNMKLSRMITYIDNALERLEESGVDTSEVEAQLDAFNAKVDEVRDAMQEAKDLFLEAQQLKEDAQAAGTWDAATQEQFKELIDQMKEKLHEAQELFREALQLFKELVRSIRALLNDNLNIAVTHATLLNPTATAAELPAAVTDVVNGEATIIETETLEENA
jgi:hypothetical protein